MALTAHGLVLSGLVDVRQRFVRLLNGIDEAALASDLGSRNVLTALRRDVEAGLGLHAQTVAAEIVGAQAAAHSNDPSTWDTDSVSALASAAVNGFLSLQNHHIAVYPHLPGTRQPSEDFLYLLYRSLGLTQLIGRHAALLTAHSTDSLTWETASFAGKVGQSGTASIAVPWLETLGPLRWPLAVHELGHFFLPDGRDARGPIEEQSVEHGWNQDAFEEVLADAVAQHYLGDAYAFALAREAYCLAYGLHVKGGLSVHTRLMLLGGPPDLLSVLPTQWNLESRDATGGALGPVGVGNDDPAVPVSEEDAHQMRSVAEHLLGERVPQDAAAVTAARALMKVGEPCSGAYLAGVTADEVAAAIEASMSAEDKPDCSSLIAAATHRALTDAEIFEAAWREETDQDPAHFVAVLGAPTTPDHDPRKEAKKVKDQDTLLARSLQSAAVHRWLDDAASLAADEVTA